MNIYICDCFDKDERLHRYIITACNVDQVLKTCETLPEFFGEEWSIRLMIKDIESGLSIVKNKTIRKKSPQ